MAYYRSVSMHHWVLSLRWSRAKTMHNSPYGERHNSTKYQPNFHHLALSHRKMIYFKICTELRVSVLLPSTHCWSSMYPSVRGHHNRHHHRQQQVSCWSTAVSTVCRHHSRFCARFRAVRRDTGRHIGVVKSNALRDDVSGSLAHIHS